MSDDFEIISMITDEIYSFIEEIGVEPTQYSYEYSFDPDNSRYRALVRILSGSVDGVADAFAEYQYEFASHMSATFPGVEVLLTVQAEDGAEITESADDTDMLLAAVVDGVDEDDISTEDIDSIERQYEDEGLYVIDEDDVEAFHIDEQDDEDDELEDEGIFTEARESDEDDYRPSAEDMEDLWRTFGGDDE